jgi:hypothetical protein
VSRAPVKADGDDFVRVDDFYAVVGHGGPCVRCRVGGLVGAVTSGMATMCLVERSCVPMSDHISA